MFAVLGVSACGAEPPSDVSIAGLSLCAGDAFFAVKGSERRHQGPLLGEVDGELAPTCVVVANDSLRPVFVEGVDGEVECTTNGFSGPPDPHFEALVCGAHRRASSVLLLDAKSRASIPFSILDAEMMEAVRSWLGTRPGGDPGDPFSFPSFLNLRLRLVASVTGEGEPTQTPRVFIDIGVCPSCPVTGFGGM
ncbi:MAG: hypothetical protein IT384_16255 [Deltaproteobacteria bacterium]|nr:hypothetical protein [Deltaproteobacteria bacterium]